LSKIDWESCENGLLKNEQDGIRPTSQKQCFTPWLGWFLKKMLMSKSVLEKQVEEDEIREWVGEQKIWEGNKTKDLMKMWKEFKDCKTPFKNWDLMEGIGEGLITKSLTMSSLFAFKMLFNSTTCDCISCSLSCFIFSLSSNSFLSFSSLVFLRFSSLEFSSSSFFFLSFISFSSCSLLAQSFSSSSFSLFF